MKFTCAVDIDKSIDKVIELFKDENNLKEWQDGFQSLEHLSGTKGEEGAKSKITYSSKGRKIELTETIMVNNLPEEFKGLYEAKEMVNYMTNKFSSLGENSTRYESDIEYVSFHGFMPKLMAFLFPGMFKKQVQKWMQQFKVFAEKN
jgi:uncharacterized membrane protein